MDEFDEETLNALKDGEAKEFKQILVTVKFSHNTLRLHLDGLVDQKLIHNEKVVREARGRPTFVYSVTSAGRRAFALLRTGVDDMVVLPFNVFGTICRFEKGGFCKMVRADCEAQICPQIGKWV
jgi:DNA-binding PadR family transcriptional regulator